MKYDEIIYEKKDVFAYITLNRPEKLNALTDNMLHEMSLALLDAESDDEVRVIILRGGGRAFSAGFDISPDVSTFSTAQDWRGHIKNGNDAFRTIWNIEKPVIAQVQGPCLGGGFELTFSCDFVVSSEKGFFGEPEILFGGCSMFFLLPLMVDMRVVKRLLFTGENVTAHEALKLNLISEVVPHEELDEAVLKLAKRIASLPAGTPQLNKRIINRVYNMLGAMEATLVSEDAAIYALTREREGELQEFYDLVDQVGTKEAIRIRNERFDKM